MAPLPKALASGAPAPLGAEWDGFGINFAVFSANATRIELCLYDAGGRREIGRYDLPERTDEVFHGYLHDARPGLIYGYRAHGPYQPEAGHRFNPHKLLLDPYAGALFGQLLWNDTLFGYRVGSARGDLSFDRRDNAAAVPKSVVMHDDFPWGEQRRPRRSWAETFLYETHVRGLSLRRADLAQAKRGTFAALGEARLIEHLVGLGVTAVELMPVHAFLQNRFLVQRRLGHYWGYSSLGFFAPERRYFADPANGAHELRAAIRRLHDAGLEVILDVVYNHTCEGNELGPTLSWRGLDNASYYRLVPGHARHFINDTGTGNTLDLTHPRVLQMVMDSLRHWATSYQVDGFRFDLCSTLGRENHGFDPGAGFFDAIRQDPLLATLKLIAEPWDVGPGGYQLGNHPPGFAEWNDRFRDAVRRYWRGDEAMRPEISRGLMGSSNLFDRRGRRPWASINFVAAHDGATLHDLVTYAERHNEANGEDGQDGAADNFGANWGVEGETEDAGIVAVRGRIVRAMLATLFLSHGTPMLLGGDEMGRTQRGNNNAYCQDNEISWYDWSGLFAEGETEAKALCRLTARLAALRRTHPSLRACRFLHGRQQTVPGVLNVAWFDESGTVLAEEAWRNPVAQLLALRRAVACPGGDVDITLMLMNASEDDREFVLPPPALAWRMLIDTADPERADAEHEAERVTVRARSLVLLAVHAERALP
ncbi:MAG: glycogen debranching protein GlgX [Acetobacteraceae bacterium]